MSKVITFSRFFPKYHPRAGQQTFFVEKIWQSLFNSGISYYGDTEGLENELETFSNPSHFINAKLHTIRSGNRWKVGDKFSPRVWSGRPYASKQIIIAPDIEIKGIYEIKIEGYMIWINKETYSRFESEDKVMMLAKNDGLSVKDFWNWFPYNAGAKQWFGQIICWGDVSYGI